MIACKFSHDASLSIDGHRCRVIGRGGYGGLMHETLTLRDYAPAIAAVYVEECLVHVYMADRSVLEISSPQDSGLTIQMLING